jgi:hypothetical protein
MVGGSGWVGTGAQAIRNLSPEEFLLMYVLSKRESTVRAITKCWKGTVQASEF